LFSPDDKLAGIVKRVKGMAHERPVSWRAAIEIDLFSPATSIFVKESYLCQITRLEDDGFVIYWYLNDDDNYSPILMIV
jgi:hypothetical protein